jgi:predicted glycosyltransferase involved in capsule biosynthesis
MLKDLTKTTFIIPIKIEHADRLRNAKTVLGFLNKHTQTNVFIFEITDQGHTSLPFVSELKNLKIRYWIGSQADVFHRTRYLNIMLDEVETPVVVNYDIDVILDSDNMLECQNRILKREADVIYPYELGNGQVQVLENFDYSGFENSGYDLKFINESNQTNKHQAECGHCIFFNTDIYRRLGGENENFVSYGPEDKERMYRFQKLGKKVEWRDGHFVYHFEHFRGTDSWVTNPYFAGNWKVFDNIKLLDDAGLSSHYVSQEYFSKYQKIGKPQ